ncbi:hypothetical protein BKA67DRAFT_534882 [Truncatella angustata]|uniref:Uncharacterized protein n=1 Tax=Truncatella angustata TaxID=152316 RepID=A0A9P8UPY6_9PEZI|nr:uncharacterized protein BKA67DRAFT_534882 [Truncatella angustata]KAH6655976.1 hypothetical protein BKA67DRAFT_534882 [Truncatella angustata]
MEYQHVNESMGEETPLSTIMASQELQPLECFGLVRRQEELDIHDLDLWCGLLSIVFKKTEWTDYLITPSDDTNLHLHQYSVSKKHHAYIISWAYLTYGPDRTRKTDMRLFQMVIDNWKKVTSKKLRWIVIRGISNNEAKESMYNEFLRQGVVLEGNNCVEVNATLEQSLYCGNPFMKCLFKLADGLHTTVSNIRAEALLRANSMLYMEHCAWVVVSAIGSLEDEQMGIATCFRGSQPELPQRVLRINRLRD